MALCSKIGREKGLRLKSEGKKRRACKTKARGALRSKSRREEKKKGRFRSWSAGEENASSEEWTQKRIRLKSGNGRGRPKRGAIVHIGCYSPSGCEYASICTIDYCPECTMPILNRHVAKRSRSKETKRPEEPCILNNIRMKLANRARYARFHMRDFKTEDRLARERV